jgi:hypothetical protein
MTNPCRRKQEHDVAGSNDPETGIDKPRRRAPPRESGTLDTIYFDWAGGFLTCLRNNDPAPGGIFRVATTSALLDSLTEPTILISEATFESFDVQKRREVIERAEKEGHRWLTTPNRQTGRHRRSMGHTDDEKTDDLDVEVIRDIARTRPATLKRPSFPPFEDDPVILSRLDANHELMLLRRTRRVVPNNSALGFKTVTAKDDYADSLIAELPPFGSLTDVQKLAIGNGKKYSKPLVAAVGKATKHSNNRREFELITGLFAHGYPSQIRSDLHHWTWRFVEKRGVSMSEFRREVRWLHHRMTELREHL